MTPFVQRAREIEFLHPWALAGLLLLPLLAWLLGRYARTVSIQVPSLVMFRGLGQAPKTSTGRLRWSWWLIPLALMIVALARPRVPIGDIPDPAHGIDIMLTVDFSGSMKERDFRVNHRQASRKDALCHVVNQFVDKRKNDRIGILGFAGGPYLVSPLTLDHEWVKHSLRQVEITRGSAIGEAIVAAIHFLKKSSDRSKVVILVTDGDNSAGRRPREVTPLVKKERVKVYTVLIRGEPLRGAALTDHELSNLSKVSGGQIFQASDTRGLEGVYQRIDELEKKEFVQKRYQSYRELFHPLIAASLMVIVIGQIISNLFRRRFP